MGPSNKGMDHHIRDTKGNIMASISGQVAGFFAEYTQGIGGCRKIMDGYLPKGYEKFRKHENLCVTDDDQIYHGCSGSCSWFERANISPGVGNNLFIFSFIIFFISNCLELNGVVFDIVPMVRGTGNQFSKAGIVTIEEIDKSIRSENHFSVFSNPSIIMCMGEAILKIKNLKNYFGRAEKTDETNKKSFFDFLEPVTEKERQAQSTDEILLKKLLMEDKNPKLLQNLKKLKKETMMYEKLERGVT
jgi:4-aminobutyrate aminotransferase-like enzyme